MDTTLYGYIDAILTADVEWILKNNSIGNANVPGIFVLTYGGAFLAFVLSVVGAYNCGATLITSLEADLFSWIDDYGGDSADEYKQLLEEIEAGENDSMMQYFLVYYATDIVILTLVVLWHINFLIYMGLAACIVIFIYADADKMLISYANNNGYNNATDVPMFNAFKLFLFGLLSGVVNYLAAFAVTSNITTVLQLIGFSGHADTETTTTQNTTYGPAGTQTITTTIETEDDSTKNFFKLQKLLNKWSILFASQRILQVAMPYAYIMILEGCVALTFSLAVVFMMDSSANPNA